MWGIQSKVIFDIVRHEFEEWIYKAQPPKLLG